MIYFSSDQHFFHKNILQHCPWRPYSNVQQMNEALIYNWNKRVKKGDTVYVLGDFSFGGREATKEVLSRLNGDKILVKGNHDKNASWMLDVGFKEVHENIFLYTGDPKSGATVRLFLSHFPYRPSFWRWLKNRLFGGYWDTRYMHKRMVNDGEWLLHGHTHSRNQGWGKQIHIGVDAWNMSPVSQNEVLALIANRKKQLGFFYRIAPKLKFWVRYKGRKSEQ